METTMATAQATVHAPVSEVWNALIDPVIIKQYFFGTDAVSDWKEGSAITWSGEWEGKAYQDTGIVLESEPEHLLKYSHVSGGESHTVTVELEARGEDTLLTLTQDNNKDAAAAETSTKNWNMILAGLKKVVEK